MKDIEFSVDGSDGKKIDMIYMVGSRQLFIWLDKIQQPKPIMLDVDYMNIAKTKENFCQVFNGSGSGNGNDGYVISAWAKFSDLINLCMYEYYKNQQANANDNANDNDGGDGLTDEYAESLNRASNRTIPKFPEDELAEIPNKDYTEFIIKTIEKEVKRDDVLVRQILYTGISTYTFDPLNLAILAPTSEGKTYATTKVMQYFPNEDVWRIGGMSTKVLVRQKGILINSKGESIQKQVDELREKLQNVNTAEFKLDFTAPKVKDEPKLTLQEKVEQRKNEIKKELSVIMEGASKLIDLTGKILVFLEPPQHELWNLLKPILSHDEEEMRYDYVDRTDDGIETKNVIVRGWPAVIFCSAKDESEWKIWPEIQSRFLITSPNMNKDKVQDGNMLIAQRKGLPNTMQQQIIVSDKDQELAKKCVVYIKKWISRLALVNRLDYKHGNAVWIPYGDPILWSRLSGNKGTDNRATNRIFSFLNIIPMAKAHLRPTLVYGNERQVIATLDDLSETLHITQNMSGIPTHKVKFFTDIFTDLYDSKTGPDIKDDKVEEIKAVTTSQLCEHYKLKTGKSITNRNLHNQFLNELLNNGFIDERESLIDKRQKIYFPIMEMPIKDQLADSEKIGKYGNTEPLRNFLQHNKIKVSEFCKKIPENWLELQILRLQKYNIGAKDKGTFQLIDENDDETSIPEFVKNYELSFKLASYFSEPKYSSFYNETFGSILNLDGIGVE